MKRHNPVIISFAAGAGVMIVAGVVLDEPSLILLLKVFNACFAGVDAILIGTIVRQFGRVIVPDHGLPASVWRLWPLPAAGVAYAVGIWIDKVIMWHVSSEGRLELVGGLWTLPSYDTPMFWAQLASIPIISVFFVHVETNVSVLMERFYGHLDKKASLRELTAAMEKLRAFVVSNIVSMFLGLIAIAALMILVSFMFMSELGLRPIYMGVLRIALVAMVFHTSAMLCFMFLLRFDLRRQALAVVTTYLVLNGGLTIMFLPAGETYYGFGNMFASAITFVLAFVLIFKESRWLHYHAFVTNNSSVA